MLPSGFGAEHEIKTKGKKQRNIPSPDESTFFGKGLQKKDENDPSEPGPEALNLPDQKDENPKTNRQNSATLYRSSKEPLKEGL